MYKIICGDSLEELRKIKSGVVDCVITSPPYWALRDYGIENQLGRENNSEDYVNKLCNMFDEVKRVLKRDGTCWLNLGDTYGGTASKGDYTDPKYKKGRTGQKVSLNRNAHAKSLLQIPSRVSLELCNRGCIRRNTIIWQKPNAMPSSAKDRFTSDFEYLFFFVKNKKYYFNQQFEPLVYNSDVGYRQKIRKDKKYHSKKPYKENCPKSFNMVGRNKRCVWSINTKPFKGGHFAVFPEELVETPLKAGCPEYICKKCKKPRKKLYSEKRLNSRPGINTGSGKSGKNNDPNKSLHNSDLSKFRQIIIRKFDKYSDCGCNAGYISGIVLDPFCGSGTVGVVAKKQNKRFIGIELNPEYCKLAIKRIEGAKQK